MAAARYWRISQIETYTGGDLVLSELALYVGETRVDASATVTSTLAPASGDLAALADGDYATTASWLAQDARKPGFAIVFDFGAASQDVTVVGLAGPALDTFAHRFFFDSSVDGVTWLAPNKKQVATKWSSGIFLFDFSQVDATESYNELLLTFDGADQSTVFTDLSPSPKVISHAGSALLSTAKSLYSGGASLFLDGVNSYLYSPSSMAYAFGSGDFTMECSVFITAAPTGDAVVFSLRNARNQKYDNLVKISPQRKLGWSDGVAWRESSGTVALNAWQHLEISRASGLLRIFIRGQKQYEASHPVDISGARILQIGAYDDDFGVPVGGFFHGYIQNARIKKGVALHSENFTPPTSFGIPPSDATPLRSAIARDTVLSGGSAGNAVAVLPSPQPSIDLQWGGKGTIYGYTKAKGTPPVPVRSRVVLLHQRSKQPVRETWSDPLTGDFWFHGIDTREQYLTLAEDAAGNFRPVAANRLEPEVV